MVLQLAEEKEKWPKCHCLFVEKVGPIEESSHKAWQELHAILPSLQKTLKIQTFVSLFKMKPQMVYRAGIIVEEKPDFNIPGLRYDLFEGGRYRRYSLTGSLDKIPEACEQIFNEMQGKNIQMSRNYIIEHYVTNPSKTEAGENITEIWVPVF